jgi:hypothetical protein
MLIMHVFPPPGNQPPKEYFSHGVSPARSLVRACICASLHSSFSSGAYTLSSGSPRSSFSTASMSCSAVSGPSRGAQTPPAVSQTRCEGGSTCVSGEKPSGHEMVDDRL